MLTTHPVTSRKQMSFFSKMTKVVPHINFTCIVNRQKLTASLTHLEDTGVLALYHVAFSDGHSDVYLPIDAEAHSSIKQRKIHDVYEAAISDDLSTLQTFIKLNEREVINFRVQEIGVANYNVWLYKRRGFYNAYCKGEYQFTLRKRQRWEVGTKREKGFIINERLASLIVKHLDFHCCS